MWCRYGYFLSVFVCMCVCALACVRSCDLLTCFNILRVYNARIRPEKLYHVPSEPDSSYFISNVKKKDLRSYENVEYWGGNEYVCHIPHKRSWHAAETKRITPFSLYSRLSQRNKRQTSNRSVSMQSNEKKGISTNCE